MEEKLKEIFDNHIEKSDYYKQRVNELIKKMEFCIQHKFEEEERITRVKFQELLSIQIQYDKIVRDIKNLIDKWQS